MTYGTFIPLFALGGFHPLSYQTGDKGYFTLRFIKGSRRAMYAPPFFEKFIV